MLNNTLQRLSFLKVLIDEESKTATGIQVSRFGQTLTLSAKKEVILSAGAIGSPHILLLSGVGPKQQLESVGVQVLEDLPGVGENLQDHLMSGFAVFANQSGSDEQAWKSLNPFDTANPLNYLEYFTAGTGMLATSGIAIGGFLHSESNTDSRPDIQIHTFPGLLTMDFDLAFRKAGNIANDVYEDVFRDYKEA